MQDQIDEIVGRLDENDNSLQEYSDSLDSQFSDLNDTISQQEDDISTLNDSSGQLTFPLSQDTIDLITEQSPTIMTYLRNNNYIGQATLVAGTVTVANGFASATSIIFLTRSTTGGTVGHLSYTTTGGSFTINSSLATDTSIINFLIIN